MNYIEQGIKVGDPVWTVQEGDTVVEAIDPASNYPIGTKKSNYMADGRYYYGHVAPSLFWSKPYDKMPEKPEPPKFQWIYKHRSSQVWELSSMSWATEADFRKEYACPVEYYEVRKFDPKETP